MYALLLCSVVGAVIVIERAINFYRIKRNTPEIFGEIREALLEGDFPRSVEVCDTEEHPVASTMKAGLLRYGKSHDEIEKAMQSVALHEIGKLERYLWILSTVAQVAPLVGFLGTVSGMITSFEALAEVGLGNPKAVSAGIAEALITTAAGLIIAVPAQITFNHYTSKVNSYTLDMETSAAMLLETFNEVEDEEEPKASAL